MRRPASQIPGTLFLLGLVAAVLSLAGCAKKQLAPNEIRAISRELVFAAKNSTGGKAEAGMRPEFTAPPAPAGAGKRGAPRELATDHIYITLPAGSGGQPDAALLAALEAELDRVAQGHALRRVAQPAVPGLVRFDYVFGSGASARHTHAIHIITPLIGRRAGSAVSPAARPQAGGARLAIIIDDLGYDRASADAVFALRFPLTLAVLPHHAYSADVAEEAQRRGYEVLLHLPMESSSDAKPEAVELRRGMSEAEVRSVLASMLDTVPRAAGVNNHQGSLATADPQLMAEVMTLLAERGLFFIDSRTTPATVAYDAAVRAHVRAASRNVFLDDVQTPEAVRRQLALAVRHARAQGSAIAIGHPHPVTLEVLERYLPEFEAHGIHLVFASELVH